MVKVKWTNRSKRDLRNIREYIAADSAYYASKFIEKLVVSIDKKLQPQPHIGNIVSEIGKQDIREIKYGPYRIVYKIFPLELHILTVWHSARLLVNHPDFNSFFE